MLSPVHVHPLHCRTLVIAAAEEEKKMAEIVLGGKRLQDLKVTELKKELDKRGLQKKGVKSVLVDRLRKAILLEELTQVGFWAFTPSYLVGFVSQRVWLHALVQPIGWQHSVLVRECALRALARRARGSCRLLTASAFLVTR